jgi:NAD(P)-dependent dehydrogenase (short-subunit alcohol dehydrogenase family)
MPTRGVLVTGASGALGAAVCKRLLDDGYKVLGVIHRDTDKLDARAVRHVADVSDEKQIEAAYDAARAAFGSLWGAVHVAGGFAMGTVASTDIKGFEAMLSINLRSTFLGCRAALRRMGGQGRIVNVAAWTAATLTGIASSAAYAASKAGVIALTKSIAEENLPDLRANAIAPGTMRTPANAAAMPKADQAGWVPLEQAAAAIAYLLSDDAPNGLILTLPSR